MGRFGRVQRRAKYGWEMPRLLSMVLMLAVLFMLINRARDPDTWRWLIRDDRDEGPAVLQPPRPTAAAREPEQPEKNAKQPEKNPEQPEKSVEKPAEQPLKATGPTDEDSDEAEFMKEAYGGVSDLTTGVAEAEMPAYQRLVQWSLNQPFALLNRRAERGALYAQLVNAPEEYRGRLLRLNLVVRRALPWDLKIYESAQPTRKGEVGKHVAPEKVVPVCEACGFTPDSGAHLYSLVLVDVPEKFPLGNDIEERVRFAGYFFKVGKYEDGLHRTNRAPVLVGRIDWHPAAVPGFQPADWYVTYGILALVLLIAIGSLGMAVLGRRRRRSSLEVAVSKGVPMTTDEWLDRAEFGGLPEGNNPDEPSDTIMGGPRSNGQSRGNGKGFPHGLDVDRPLGE